MKIKEGRQRYGATGEEEIREGNEPSFNEILISNGDDPMGSMERDIGRKEVADGEGEENNAIVLGIDATSKRDNSGSCRRDIQALLKETMAGSMREVIKDELQAWLGLKTQGQDDVVDLGENIQEEGEMAENKEEGHGEGIQLERIRRLSRLQTKKKRT